MEVSEVSQFQFSKRWYAGLLLDVVAKLVSGTRFGTDVCVPGSMPDFQLWGGSMGEATFLLGERIVLSRV